MKPSRPPSILHRLSCVLLVLLCGCPNGTPHDHSRAIGHGDTGISISPNDDSILFNANGNGGRDIYLLHLDGLSIERITDSENYEGAPSFSQDGTKIAYAAGIPGDRADHIFINGRDGKSPKQLTNIDANDASPQFSPDGSLIAFARDTTYDWGGLAANWDVGGVICVIRSDGTGERQLTQDDDSAYCPFFTADGKSVMYSTADGWYSIPVDGSGSPTMIGPFTYWPDLSRDRTKVVFSDGEFSPDHELFISNLDGTGRLQITNSEHGCFHGLFTRDKTRVYFLMEEWPDGLTDYPKSSLWTVQTDGTGQTQITDLSLFDDPMNWKPKRLR